MDTVKQDSSFKAGLNSADLQIPDNSAYAREKLLRIGRFDFLEID
ncbi:hypothetical protein [Methylicorpusculum sp.]|nr:hypothetical protein [Methylicorpusculum sp.]MDP3528360.1 hypothetical protein [Methylicorpusculum sp.]MDZ4154162.1 hypothetical protein [Methylicorpusculum sp.]